ncbi:MAG: YraN family protein [Clostridia bacterium]|nr:YraN family protein [Clostridia bacterium]
MDKYALGDSGEMIAQKFLIENGYVILDTNVRYVNVGEIDIVAKDGGTLAFIEVRARSDRRFGHPLETITPAKIKRIVAASRKYLSLKRVPASGYRYDVVSVLYGEPQLIKNAFYARWN